MWIYFRIIAVNYAARDKGCTKGMWMNEAKQKCPDIKFARVTNVRGRADLTKYKKLICYTKYFMGAFV